MKLDKIYFLCDASNKYAENYINEFAIKNEINDKLNIWYVTPKLYKYDMTKSFPELKNTQKETLLKSSYTELFISLTEHYTIVKQAYERDFNNILVIDSNIIFNSEFNIIKLIEQIPNDANIVSFTSDKYTNSGNYFDYTDNVSEPGNVIYYLDRNGMKHFYQSLDDNYSSKNVPFTNIKEPLKMAVCNYNLLK